MNTPIDPREGDRRQKALRARLAALAQNNKALIGKLGQNRGRVRSMGAVGGARGARIAANGAPRPGALNFLPGRGFGLRVGGPVGGPAMHPVFGAAPPRHAAAQLPTRTLPGGPTPTIPNPNQGNIDWVQEQMAAAGLDPSTAISSPAPTMGGGPAQPGMIGPEVGPDMSFLNTVAPDSFTQLQTSGGLIPLGGGRYMDPTTGVIHGGGSGHRFSG